MAIVQNDHFAGGRFTDGHPGASQAITLASVLDLILPIAELEREAFGQGAGGVAGEDQPECLAVMEPRPMAVDRALWRPLKALVVALDEGGQPGVGSVDAVNACQSHFFDQTVLQGAVGSLGSTLGLGSVGMDEGDVQGFESACELGQLAFVVRVVVAKNAVFVRV